MATSTVFFVCLLGFLSWPGHAHNIRMNCPVNGFACTSERQFVCLADKPHIRPAEMPINFTVGMFGDQGMTTDSEGVLRMLKGQGVELILHAGDIAYDNDNQPERWLNMLQNNSGDIHYLAAVGNHDAGEAPPGWGLFESHIGIFERARRLGTCEGETGVQYVCTYKGLTVVLTAPGITGKNHDEFIAWAFATYPSPWRICVWHKNMQSMNPGTKGDEAGWNVYEECRRQGAMIVTAHEHLYARSWEMSSFETQAVSRRTATLEQPTTLRTESKIDGITGTGLAIVSGMGGYSMRDIRTYDGWWAQLHGANTGADYGSLICKYNYNGDATLAMCYFMEQNGKIADTFYVRTEAPAVAGTVLDVPTFVKVQVASESDDSMEYSKGGVVLREKCDNKGLTIGRDAKTSQESIALVLRFRDVPVGPWDAEHIVSARIDWVIASNPNNGANNASFEVAAELSVSPAESCGKAVVPRTWSEPIDWSEVSPWDLVDEDLGPGHTTSTPDLKTIIKKVIEQPSWTRGGDMVFTVRGSADNLGMRSVESFESDSCGAPTLVIEFENKCLMEGATRPCSLHHGSGFSTCSESYWGLCKVEKCDGDFQLVGDGCFECQAGQELDCVVKSPEPFMLGPFADAKKTKAPMTMGIGSRKCTPKGAWGVCEAKRCLSPLFQPVGKECQPKPWDDSIGLEMLANPTFTDKGKGWQVRTDSIEFSQWTTSFVPTGGFKFEVRAPGLMPYDMELNLDQAFLLEPGWTYQLQVLASARLDEGFMRKMGLVMQSSPAKIKGITIAAKPAPLFNFFTAELTEKERMYTYFVPMVEELTIVKLGLGFGGNLGDGRTGGLVSRVSLRKQTAGCQPGKVLACAIPFGTGKATCTGTFNTGTSYVCTVTSCEKGRVMVDNQCMECDPNTTALRACDVFNGNGTFTCSALGVKSTCKVTECAEGFNNMGEYCNPDLWGDDMSIEVVEEPNFESTGQWGIYENYDNGADWIRAVDEGKFVATILTPGPLSADLQLWTMALLYPDSQYQVTVWAHTMADMKRNMQYRLLIDGEPVFFDAKPLTLTEKLQPYTFNFFNTYGFVDVTLALEFGGPELGARGSTTVVKKASIRELLPSQSPTLRARTEAPTSKPTIPTAEPTRQPSMPAPTAEPTAAVAAPTPEADDGIGVGCEQTIGNRVYYFNRCEDLGNGFILGYSLHSDLDKPLATFALTGVARGGWMALGFSKTGRMLGSTAVVGWHREGQGPQLERFKLASQYGTVFEEVPAGVADLKKGEIVYEGNKATMVFTISTEGISLDHLIFSMGAPGSHESNHEGGAHASPSSGVSAQASSGRQYDHDPTPFKVDLGPAARGLTAIKKLPDLQMHVVKGSIRLTPELLSAGMEPVARKTATSAHVAHGVLMALAWGVCMPLGILNNRLFKGKYANWRLVHKAFQSTGLLFSVIAFIIAISTFKVTTSVGYAHATFGTIIVIASVAQAVLGIVSSLFGKRSSSPTAARGPYEKAHFVLGYFTQSLAVLNMILGITLIGGGAVAWGFFVAGLILYLAVFGVTAYIRKAGELKGMRTQVPTEAMETEELQFPTGGGGLHSTSKGKGKRKDVYSQADTRPGEAYRQRSAASDTTDTNGKSSVDTQNNKYSSKDRRFPIPQSNSTSPENRPRLPLAVQTMSPFGVALSPYGRDVHRDGEPHSPNSTSSQETVVSLQFSPSHQREPSGSCSPTC